MALLDFLLAVKLFLFSLPIIVNDDNVVRVDPDDPMKETGVYCDKWERPVCARQSDGVEDPRG